MRRHLPKIELDVYFLEPLMDTNSHELFLSTGNTSCPSTLVSIRVHPWFSLIFAVAHRMPSLLISEHQNHPAKPHRQIKATSKQTIKPISNGNTAETAVHFRLFVSL